MHAFASMILAQNGQPPQGPGGFGNLLVPLVLMGLIFYFLIFRPQSRERKHRQEMLTTIKKNDRVVTVGGIIGTVVNVKEDELTLKVDESNNTKLTFTRSAVQRILTSAGGEPAPDEKK